MDIVRLDLNRQGDQPENPPDSAFAVEQLQALIRGIGFYAIKSHRDDAARFEKELSEIATSLTEQHSADDVLVAAGKTLRLSEAYNERAAIVFKGQIEELRGMIETMTGTVQFIVSSSEASVKQLSFMETQLHHANTLSDLRQLKTYAGACLSLVRKENIRLRTETQERIAALKSDVERLSGRLKIVSVEESVDPVTGLSARVAAEQIVEHHFALSKDFVVAVFAIQQLSIVNGRFGRTAGDEVVVTCAQMLARKLPGVTLYRWSGPGFLGVFHSTIAANDAEKRARHAAAEKIQMNLEADHRMAMVVVGLTCHVIRINPNTMTLHEVFQTADQAVELASQTAAAE